MHPEVAVSRQFDWSAIPECRRVGSGGHLLRAGQGGELVEGRRHPRFRLEAEIRVYPRNSRVVRGQTVDISESGISAILRVEVPIGEVVRLEFSLPPGDVEIHALVRQRNAFRYGFQFLESTSAQEIIAHACTQLAIEQALFGAGPV